MKIVFEEGRKQSAAYDGEKPVGNCTYEEENGVWRVEHTYVDKDYGGQGIAKKLLDCVLDEARKRSVKIVPVCSYVVREFEKHPEAYADVVK
ncbi:MAG: GNAT family N-acetyltransferase [Treponema sp.]